MQDPFTTGQQQMFMQTRQGFQQAEQNMERDLTRKYGRSNPGVGGSAVQDQIRKGRDNYHSAESFLQRNPGAVRPGSTNPTGDLRESAMQNAMDSQQRFKDQGMADNIRDQARMQRMADPYMREQDKRNIDRMNAASQYAQKSQQKYGTGAMVNYRQPGTASRIKNT
jgi:hypothetical protein